MTGWFLPASLPCRVNCRYDFRDLTCSEYAVRSRTHIVIPLGGRTRNADDPMATPVAQHLLQGDGLIKRSPLRAIPGHRLDRASSFIKLAFCTFVSLHLCLKCITPRRSAPWPRLGMCQDTCHASKL